MKVLVLATDYTSNEGRVSLHYIHTRNLEYIQNGLEVDVLNFSAVEGYNLEGINVITKNDFLNQNKKYDVLISHAPNLRMHYRFIKKNIASFKKTIMFFHGHEVLRISEAYPEPYEFMKKKSAIKDAMRDMYDTLKFFVWRKFFKKNQDVELVFVSEWMYGEFLKNLKINKESIKNVNIIYNSVGKIFEEENYSPQKIKYDFVTIRNALDQSKYCIDVVWELAKRLPEKRFLVVGKGNFFDHFEKLSNIDFVEDNLNHEEIISKLNSAKYALLPTRTDAQGVMACEMITFGIPLITSDIVVTEEIFGDIPNVLLIKNSERDYNDFSETLKNFNVNKTKKLDKFFAKNTILKEIDLIKK